MGRDSETINECISYFAYGCLVTCLVMMCIMLIANLWFDSVSIWVGKLYDDGCSAAVGF